MKILSSKDAYSYKLQLEQVREQMRMLEENGVYDVAGNRIRKEDQEQYRQLKRMEFHLRQLASGIEKPKPFAAEKKVEKVEKKDTRPRLTDEQRLEMARKLSEVRKNLGRCVGTLEK